MKMKDMFDLPIQKAINELAIIDKNDLVVGWSDAFTGEQARDSIVFAINNHDRLVDTLRELTSAVTTVQLRGYKHLPSMRDRQRAHGNAIKLLAELEGDK